MRERFRRQSGQNSVDFAATPVNLTEGSDRRYLASVLSASKKKSKNSWDWYDKLGEIHQGIGRSARIGGYADLGVYKLDKNGEIGERVTTGLPGEIGSMLYSPYGGSRGLIERFLTLIKVPADAYLIQMMNGTEPDGFDFVSADELRMADSTALIDTSPGAKVTRITLPAKSQWADGEMDERIAPANFIGRVWRPSPRWVDLPDSPLAALDLACEQLHLLTLATRAKLLSRLAMNGIVYVPSEVSETRTVAPDGEPNEFHRNPVLNEIIKSAVFAARSPGEPEAALPIFMTGPGAYADNFKHFTLDEQLFETDMHLRAELIDRILTGLEVQPSQVKGSQDSNHWGAWAASDDEVRVSVKPDLETMCWALTRLVLWRRMQDAGAKPGTIAKHVIWYDLSRATSHVNAAEDARQLFDRGLIGGDAARRESGMEERDAATSDELIRMVGWKMNVPRLALWKIAGTENIPWDEMTPTKTGPAPKSSADEPKAGPGNGQPGSPSNNTSKTPARLRPA